MINLFDDHQQLQIEIVFTNLALFTSIEMTYK